MTECEGGVSAGPLTPPLSYDKVMTAILQELKFLHMQSASQGELNELPCKDLLDGTAVNASLLCRHVHSLHNPKDPFHSEESKLSEHLSLCRITMDQNGFTFWCPIFEASFIRTATAIFMSCSWFADQQAVLSCVLAQAGLRSDAQRRFDSPDIVNKKPSGPFVTIRQTKHGQAL